MLLKNQQVPGDLLGELSRSIKCPSRSPREEPCRAEIRLADAGPLEAQSAVMPEAFRHGVEVVVSLSVSPRGAM